MFTRESLEVEDYRVRGKETVDGDIWIQSKTIRETKNERIYFQKIKDSNGADFAKR